MKDAQPKAIYRSDYQPADFEITETKLDFQLFEDHALVKAELQMNRRKGADADAPLVLHGQELELLELGVDGADAEYEVRMIFLAIRPQGLMGKPWG